MKRFFTILFLYSTICTFAQNLIPNPSVEDYIDCPTSLGNIETYISSWQSFRGTPDYWNSCSENPLLGWNNSMGFQEPRTGDGYLGLFTFHQGLTNARESFGIELDNSLEIGETYYLSFHISTAYRAVAFNLASNNIGVLFMVDNFLNSNEQGILPNYSNFALDEIVSDTINWVNVSYSFVSDSAYRYLCFGNFYDDSLTDTLRIAGDVSNALSYYYFDDFCLSLDPADCDYITSNISSGYDLEVSLYPNPARYKLNIKTGFEIQDLEIFNISGEIQSAYKVTDQTMKTLLLELTSGMYILNMITEKEVFKKRFVVQ